MNVENFEATSSSRTPAQVAAAKQAEELSQVIIHQYPGIALDYQDAKTHCSLIAQNYNIANQYRVSRRVATEAVRLAIKTLFPDDQERKNLSLEHEKMNGFEVRDQKKGFHAMSPEKKSALGKRNGMQNYINKVGIHAQSYEDHYVQGKMLQKNKLGIFAMTLEQRAELSRRGGLSAKQMKKGIFSRSREENSAAAKKSVLSRGLVPWDTLIDPESGLNEGEFCDRLIINIGLKLIFKNYGLVAQILNNLFHDGKPIRTENSIYHRSKKLKRSLAA